MKRVVLVALIGCLAVFGQDALPLKSPSKAMREKQEFQNKITSVCVEPDSFACKMAKSEYYYRYGPVVVDKNGLKCVDNVCMTAKEWKKAQRAQQQAKWRAQKAASDASFTRMMCSLFRLAITNKRASELTVSDNEMLASCSANGN